MVPTDISRSTHYDTLGRPSSTQTTVTMETFTTSTTYNADGKPASVTFPTGTVFDYVYTDTGRLREIAHGTTVFWRAEDMDADGHITEETLGNGLTTLRDYDPNTGRLQNIFTDDGATNTVQDLTYVFDLVGNLTYREDIRQSVSEDFTYDTLNRLKTTTLIDTSTSQTLSTKSYNYDAIGNLTYKSDVGGYAYGAGNAGPHAVTSAGGNTLRLRRQRQHDLGCRAHPGVELFQ